MIEESNKKASAVLTNNFDDHKLHRPDPRHHCLCTKNNIIINRINNSIEGSTADLVAATTV